MQRNSIFWGVILVLAGGLLLLDNLNILNVNIWGLFWPVLLIALGAWFLWGTLNRREVEMEHANVPLEGASRARLRIRHGAGRLNLSAGAPMGDLAEGDFGGGVDVQSRRQGDLLDTSLSVPVQFAPFQWAPGSSLDWTLGLARDVPISLDFETGASESFIDLSELRVSDVRLKSGASSTRLTLPANAGFTRASIETGAAAVRVEIPSGVAAQIRAHSGLASVTVDTQRFPRNGDVYQSPDYDGAANKVELRIETGVGSVDVR